MKNIFRKKIKLKKQSLPLFVVLVVASIALALSSIVIPKIMAGDTVVSDLHIQAQSEGNIISLHITDENESDTKVVVPLPDSVTYKLSQTSNIGVTEDTVNRQLVIDWVDGQAKDVNLQLESKNSGVYDFVVQTVREGEPVNSPVSSVKVTFSNDESGTSESSNIEKTEPTISEEEQSEEPTNNDQSNTFNSGEKKEVESDNLVTKDDFENQEYFISAINLQLSKLNKPTIESGATYEDLKGISGLYIQNQSGKPGQHIPEKLADLLPNLTQLWVQYSAIEGEIPKNIGNLTKLTQLYLDHNALSGSIPDELTNLKNLTILNLSTNNLSGHIPNFELDGNKVTIFSLARNKLTGEIPKGIYNMRLAPYSSDTKSRKIDLSQNYLSGIIPDDFVQNTYQEYVQDNSTVRYDLSSNELVLSDWAAIQDFTYGQGYNKNYIPGGYSSKFLKDSFMLRTVKTYSEEKLYFFKNETSAPAQNFGYSSEVTKGEHTFTITNSKGETIYQGPANPDFSIAAPNTSEKYTVRMDGVAFEPEDKVHFVSVELDYNPIEKPEINQNIQVNNNLNDINNYVGDKLTFKVDIENTSDNSTVTNARNTIFIPKEFEVNKDSIVLLDSTGKKIDNANVYYTEGVSYNSITVEDDAINFFGKNKVTVQYDVLAKIPGAFQTKSQVVYYDSFNLPQKNSEATNTVEVKNIDPWNNDFDLRPEDTTKFDTTNSDYPALTTLTKNEKTPMIYKVKNTRAPRDETLTQFDLWLTDVNWKDDFTVDKSSFYIKKNTTNDWEKVAENKIDDTTSIGDKPSYTIKDLDLKLAKGETIEIKFSITAKSAIAIKKNAIAAQGTIKESGSLSSLNSLVVKNGELRFENVPDIMSFKDSKISNRTVESSRKDKDWKITVEDTRLEKKPWRVTTKLLTPFKDTTGAELQSDILLFRKTGQEDQWINNTSETDVYDGTSTKEDYYDVSWSSNEGPLIQVAPGTVKVGQYKGVMQWSLIDAPV